MTFTDSQHGKANNEFETINFDTEEDSSKSEIVGNDPKRREVRRRSKTCRRCCKCLNYLFLLAMVTCALYFTIIKVLDKNRKSTDFTNAVYTIRINTGASGPYYDSNNNYWLPDYKIGTNDDFVVSVEGSDNADDEADESTTISDMCPINVAIDAVATETDTNIYCTDRSFTSTGRYEIAVPENNAPYQIDLYFAEIIYNEVGERAFDVLIEDFIVDENYDIVKEAGGRMNMAVRLRYIIDVDDGYVSIVFKSKVNAAKINGIVVQRTDTLGDRR